MGCFHGFRTCATCGTANASGHFLDLNGERFCLPCFVKQTNPNHDGLDAMIAARDAKLAKWSCQKWRRTESKLPNGPKSY